MILVFFNINSKVCKSQTKIDIKDREESKWRNNFIMKNILTYRLYEYFSGNSIKNYDIRIYNFEDIDKMIPKNSCNFIYSYEKVETLIFPDTNYILYNFKIDMREIYCENSGTTLLRDWLNYWFDEKHLIAVRKVNDKGGVIPISGNFFVDNISSYYHFNVKDPNSFMDYLKLSTYKFGMDSITFVKRKKNNLIFCGKIPRKADILIYVDLKNKYKISYKPKCNEKLYNCMNYSRQPFLSKQQYIYIPGENE